MMQLLLNPASKMGSAFRMLTKVCSSRLVTGQEPNSMRLQKQFLQRHKSRDIYEDQEAHSEKI